MDQLWAIAMMVSGGLFAGGVMSIAWERVPAWRRTHLPDFRIGFAHTLRRVDRLQPALPPPRRVQRGRLRCSPPSASS
jgi:hypothetical protein